MIEALISLIPGGTLTLVLSWLGIIGLAIWRIFAAGGNRERAKQARADINAMKAKKEKDDEVDSLGHADVDTRFQRWMRDDKR